MRIFDWGNPNRYFGSVAFDPTGRLVAACGGDKATLVWDIVTGAERARLLPVAYAVQFQPHTGRLVVATKDGIRVGEVNTGTPAKVVDAFQPHIPTFALNDDWAALYLSDCETRAVLAGISRFGEAEQKSLWEVPVRKAKSEYGHTVCLACLPDGEHFLSAEYRTGETYEQSRRIALRSRADGRVIRSWSGEVFGYGDQMFGSPLCRAVVVQNGMWLRVHEVEDMAAPPRVIRNDNKKHFTDLAFHPSGRFLAATSNDETVKLYDTTTWEVARTFTWDIGRMRSVAFSPDGTLAAAGSDKGKVVVWDVDV